MVEDIALLVAPLSNGGGDIQAFSTSQTMFLLRLLFFVIGATFLTATIIDLLWTTLWGDEGVGPLSSRLMSRLWQGLRYLDGGRSWVLSIGGPLILSLNLVMWIGFVWVGWTFIFASGESAIVHTRSPSPITWSDRIYFVASAMFTMGNGDFYPASSAWQIATAFTTASGMLSVTLSVAYVVSILGAVVDSRSFANSVMGVGKQREGFVRTGWNGDDFHRFGPVLDALASELSHLAAQHKTHPILHYYRPKQGQNSSVVAFAIFDEALTLLRFGVPEEYQPNDALLEIARSNAQSYLRAFTDTIEPADRAPPPPELDHLRDAGIPTVSDEEFADALNDLDERRRQLLAVVEAGEWSWPPEDEE